MFIVAQLEDSLIFLFLLWMWRCKERMEKRKWKGRWTRPLLLVQEFGLRKFICLNSSYFAVLDNVERSPSSQQHAFIGHFLSLLLFQILLEKFSKRGRVIQMRDNGTIRGWRTVTSINFFWYSMCRACASKGVAHVGTLVGAFNLNI